MSTKRRSGQRQPTNRQPTGRGATSRGRSRPLPPGDTLLTPDASPARQAVERRSAAPLVYLRHLPTWLIPVVLAAALIVGLAVHGIGGTIALCVVALFLGWLALVSWPRLAPPARAVRIAVIALVLIVAAIQATH